MASREEFAPLVAYLGASVGKSMPPEQVEVYYDLLGRLPAVVLWQAAREVLRQHLISTVPTPGEIYQTEAVATFRGLSRTQVEREARLHEERKHTPLLPDQLREQLGLAMVGRMPRALPDGGGAP